MLSHTSFGTGSVIIFSPNRLHITTSFIRFTLCILTLSKLYPIQILKISRWHLSCIINNWNIADGEVIFAGPRLSTSAWMWQAGMLTTILTRIYCVKFVADLVSTRPTVWLAYFLPFFKSIYFYVYWISQVSGCSLYFGTFSISQHAYLSLLNIL